MPYSIASRLSSVCAIFLLFCSPAHALNFGKDYRVKISKAAASRTQVTRAFKKLLARVTVYWAKEDRWSCRHKSSTGIRLRRNAVAVDPRVIPYGSRIKFPDAICHAIDTGSAVKSRLAARKAGRTLEEKAAIVVDRFFETKREALAWARVHPLFMPLDILPPERTF